MQTKQTETFIKSFNINEETLAIFKRAANAPIENRKEIIDDIGLLTKSSGMSLALIALFRQQVGCGFVLADPLLANKDVPEREFQDPQINIAFRLQRNPYREMRRNHGLLIERGIIDGAVDTAGLVNRDAGGKACYLCKENIDLQNPKEILIKLNLGGAQYYAGANFAFITDNHFTVMNASHVPQHYRKGTIEAMMDFVDITAGVFKAIYNGLAGASIKDHEHLQVTTEDFPVENIAAGPARPVFENKDIKVLNPDYYLPVWIVEGLDKAKTNNAVHNIISLWINLNPDFHTINIITSKGVESGVFRAFIFLRDKRKLGGKGKRGAMATFEAGGNIILTCLHKEHANNHLNENLTLENANLPAITQMLKDISPDNASCKRFAEAIDFSG